MNKHNLGFALLLLLLFIAPELPLRGPGLSSDQLNVSTGLVGLAIWFMLSSPRFGLRALYSTGVIFLLVMLGCYMLLSSLLSLNSVSIARSLQYLYYIVLCSALVPAYLNLRAGQGRISEVYSIFAWISAIYSIGLIISIWTGPIYPHQVGSVTRYYENMEVPRAVGFAAGVNGAGGIAAVMAAFCLFIYGRRARFGHLLTFLCLLGMVLTLSRSALLSFAVAMAGLGLVFGLRVLLMRFRHPPVARIVLGLALVAPVAVILLALDAHRLAARGLYYGLGLYNAAVEGDTDGRLEIWRQGLDAWVETPALQKIVGVGFLNSAHLNQGVYDTSHNLYIQMLNDFGIIGLVMLIPVLFVPIARSAYAVFTNQSDGINVFCFVGLVAFAVHNLTETFLYHPSGIFILVFSISLTHIYGRKREPADPACSALAVGLAPWRRWRIIDEALPTVELSDDQKQRVQELHT